MYNKVGLQSDLLNGLFPKHSTRIFEKADPPKIKGGPAFYSVKVKFKLFSYLYIKYHTSFVKLRCPKTD